MIPYTNPQIMRQNIAKKTVITRPIPESGVRILGNFLVNHTWEEVLNESCPHEKVIAFHKTLQDALDNFLPTKEIQVRNNLDKKWMTPELKTVHRKMQREFWRNRRSEKWRALKKKFKVLKKRNCRNFYTSFVTDLKATKPGNWYNMAKKIGAIGVTSQEVHVEALADLSNQEAADAIANHYAQISQSYSALSLETLPAILPAPVPAPLIEEYQVNERLQKLKKTKSTFPGDLPYTLRKEFSVELSLPLTNIYRCCLEKGVYPNQWKQELVTPVPKVVSPLTIKDLRKITCTSEFSKLFEGIVIDWIYEDIGCSIDPAQYGNQKGTGTEHLLVFLIDRILVHLEPDIAGDPCAVIASFLDWSAAFDRQCPELAIKKFINMNLRPCLVPLLASYLQDRKMVVKFRDAKSNKKDMPGGGPQGTLWGVLEYIVNSNDNCDCVDVDDRYKYVDDASILEVVHLLGLLTEYNFHHHVASDISTDHMFLPIENIDMQETLNSIAQWTTDNKMLINGKKSNYMIFNRTVNHQFSTRLNLSGTLLENIEEIKLLGVWITNDLSWTKNTEELCKKAFARISMITKLMYVGVSTEDLLEIYTLFI